MQVDARGLPLIAIALLLTGLPEAITALRAGSWVALLVAAALTVWVAKLHLDEERRLAVGAVSRRTSAEGRDRRFCS